MDLPALYFRTRENGATVFRVETDARNGRLDLVPLANVHLRNGTVRPQGGRTISATEEALIRDWMAARTAELAARGVDDLRRTIDHLNEVAHRVQTGGADAEAVETLTDALLLAMHDLRAALVKRRADRLLAQDAAAAGDGD